MSLAGVDCRCRAELDRVEPDRAEPDRAEPDGAEPDGAEPDRSEAARSEAAPSALGRSEPEPGRSDDSLRPDCSLIDVTVS